MKSTTWRTVKVNTPSFPSLPPFLPPFPPPPFPQPVTKLTHSLAAIEAVAPTVCQHQPNILFSASMWSPEQVAKIRQLAERERPGIATYAIPQGLQVERGPDAVVEHLVENVPGVLEGVEL